ncbi:MAG: protein translocase subunit SecDF [Cytophagaceae bacterium]|nr:protein translocase subunit SecDF [Cytophagaceae bacterium]
MRNRKGIIALTIIITLLCLYNLSFTLISRGVQQDATDAATNAKGQIDLNKKQKYLDSVYQAPVFNFLGLDYTYKEVKEKELGLGLDLQGGMHVVLEVSPVEILKALAGPNATDPHFASAITRAKELQKTSQSNFTDLFYQAYKEINPGRPLNAVFLNTITREKGITNKSSEDDIKKMLDEEVAQSIDRAEHIIRTRIDKFGVIQPNIQRLAGTNRIQLELPGVDNPQRVRNLLQGIAQLEFLEVYFNREISAYIQKINDYLITVEKPKASDKKTDKTAADTTSLFANEDSATATTKPDTSKVKTDTAATAKKDSTEQPTVSSLLTLNKDRYSLAYSIKDTAKINAIFNMPRVKQMIPSNMKFLWEKGKKAKIGEGEEEDIILSLIAVKKEKGGRGLTGESIINASVDSDPTQKEIQVSMEMNDAGAKKWRNITREAAQQNEGGMNRRIAIALDDVIYSAPEVKTEIPNGRSVISGNFDIDEANDLATILEAGKLPAPVRIVEEVVVGPTLGKEAIAQGLTSMVVGLLIVIFFMIFYYNKAGIVADIALLFNVLLILGIMANFNAVLTLPGIAGILLSIAIAVDANVLINERVKEDLNEGKSLDTAISSGYKNASSAILDSNVTTLIKGFVLLGFGTGLIYGFAVTLIIGIFCSLFTSVLISRVIFGYFLKRKQNISFGSPWTKNLFKNIHINFIGKRKLYYAISGLIIAAGIVSLVVKGLNLGVDFKGGRTFIVQMNKPSNAEEIRKALTSSLGTAPEVKTYGSNVKYKITTSYLVDDESEGATLAAEQKLKEGLMKIENAEILSSSKVGPTIADDIKVSAIYSLGIAIALMFLYILIRFRKWQFAFGTIVSLVHVVLVVLSIFSLLDGLVPFSLEIDQAFVAAILTVIGYSINDSVVVFDRIREFLTLHRADKDFSTVINNALNDTLSRTLITGMSTIFVIIILFIFGGETIKGFSFAMLIGVLIGTYSSLCIGSPVLVDFANWGSSKEKEKETVKA